MKLDKIKLPSLDRFLPISKKNKVFTGIELDTDYARVSILEKDGEDLIFSIMPFEIQLTGDNEQDGFILRQELERRGLNVKIANFSIPVSAVLIKNLKLPKVSEKEMIDAIEWNIKEDIENLKAETVYDYSIIHEDKDFYDIVVVIAKNKQINRVLEVAENAKIEVDIIEPSAMALLNLAFLQKEKVDKNKEEKNICLIHLDKNDSYLLFSNNNVIIQPIEMNFKLYEMLDPDAKEQEVMRLINEINYFFLTLQEPKIIYTSGLFVKYPEIKAYTQLKFSTRFILEDIDSVLSLNIKYSGNFPIQIYNTSISLAYRGLE
ncbi:MAG TPA: pilus assembly protein PilM [Sulfurihydrogenibium sp.]|uniref:pilus assembly protein PilM n=1 Tax=Sulfurihydrogenibium sp. (strain YO3AOP1) TaxID=436114 RepID=UPI0001723D24|nr:pilus assembly protein PilM [Sulfurihydrogenibium sp. YO3AOP1]HBT98609.1 pilus assembly protein PilM [Sulfurihydrogenibium sp.]